MTAGSQGNQSCKHRCRKRPKMLGEMVPSSNPSTWEAGLRILLLPSPQCWNNRTAIMPSSRVLAMVLWWLVFVLFCFQVGYFVVPSCLVKCKATAVKGYKECDLTFVINQQITLCEVCSFSAINWGPDKNYQMNSHPRSGWTIRLILQSDIRYKYSHILWEAQNARLPRASGGTEGRRGEEVGDYWYLCSFF